MKKLVVGQHVHMGTGTYLDEGDVVEILPDGGYVVDVTPFGRAKQPGGVGWLFRHFDKDGIGLPYNPPSDPEPTYKGGVEGSRWSEGPYEGGRWELYMGE
jgi:hypothetical protein